MSDMGDRTIDAGAVDGTGGGIGPIGGVSIGKDGVWEARHLILLTLSDVHGVELGSEIGGGKR
jgi:hypothetical protein